MRGRRLCGGGGDEGLAWRRLLIAVVIQAVRDAHEGDNEAAAFLDDSGDVALSLDRSADAFAGWRGVEVPAMRVRRRKVGRRESSAERSRRYRWEKKMVKMLDERLSRMEIAVRQPKRGRAVGRFLAALDDADLAVLAEIAGGARTWEGVPEETAVRLAAAWAAAHGGQCKG